MCSQIYFKLCKKKRFLSSVPIFRNHWMKQSIWGANMSKNNCLPPNTGWSKGSEYCNITMKYWKMPKRDKLFFYSRVLIRRFDYLPFFYFVPKNLSIKFFWKLMESCYLFRMSELFYCPTSSAFCAILKDPSRQTEATFSNQFSKLVE